MVSVISASNRPERLDITQKCLARQHGVDYEWIVVCPVIPKVSANWVKDPPKAEGDVYALNKAMNAGLKVAKGELIVRIDDSIWFPPDALEKFWFWYTQNNKVCVSGVGDQYDQLDDVGKPTHKVWLDPRKTDKYGTFYECNPEDWEGNFGSIPRDLIEEIGGWDEQMDRYYAWDNVAVAYRLQTIGAQFYLDQTNESFSFQHGRSDNWDKDSWANHNFWEWFKTRPVKLDYLG